MAQTPQSSVYKISHGDIMYGMVITVNNSVLHIWNLLRVDFKSSHPNGKKCDHVRWQMLTRLPVVVISQWMQIWNHCVVHLKLTQHYMSTIHQYKRDKICYYSSIFCHLLWITNRTLIHIFLAFSRLEDLLPIIPSNAHKMS